MASARASGRGGRRGHAFWHWGTGRAGSSVAASATPEAVPMRRFVRPLLLTALTTCCAAAFAATADQAPQGRLPGWASPQSYQLSFKVDPAQEDFSGTTTIKEIGSAHV